MTHLADNHLPHLKYNDLPHLANDDLALLGDGDLPHHADDDLSHLADDDLSSADDPVFLFPDEGAGPNVLHRTVQGGILPYLSLRHIYNLLNLIHMSHVF